jgi:hypothetical protein
MINLVIKIEKNGKEQTAEIELPESWNEVPADVYPYLASLYLATDAHMSPFDKTVRAFTLLTWKHWRIIEQLEETELYDLVRLIDWVFDKLDLTVNHIPEFKIGVMTFIGPSNGMENLRFAEWCTAFSYAQAVPEDDTLESLQYLAACLYRPAGSGEEYTPGDVKYRGDLREKFNEQLIESRKDVMALLDRTVLHGIYVWFCSCRYQILHAYENLNKPPKGNKNVNGSWIEVYDDLRSDPKYGGPDKLEDEWLSYILFSLDRSILKMEELKQKYDI